MRRFAVALIAVCALAATPRARAQQSETVGAVEVRPLVGMFVPTGVMRNDFRDAALYGLQGGLEVNSNLHLLLNGFYSRNNTHFRTLSARQADLWQFDAGAEFNLIRPMGRAWFFRPFAGAGLGFRMYDYKATRGSNTCAAAYGSAGAEAQRFTGAIRLEARDYVSCYESPLTSSKKTRNDLGFMLGFVYHMM